MDNTNNTQKIRFKFAGGEEFEAEGSLEFIESQRDYFLSLVKKKPQAAGTAVLRGTTAKTIPTLPHEDASVSGTLQPGVLAANNTVAGGNSPLSAANTAFPGNRLWEQLLTQEGDNLFLRRKLHLSASDAALILLAGGKEILGKPGCSALWLARALDKSGFALTRLDRLLAPAVKLGHIQSEGSKRSRLYALTPAGFAHAFVLAGKKAESLL